MKKKEIRMAKKRKAKKLQKIENKKIGSYMEQKRKMSVRLGRQRKQRKKKRN